MEDEQQPAIDEMLIFGWAQEHKARSKFSAYPIPSSGVIESEQGSTAGLRWSDIDVGLKNGTYGLPAGLTLRVFIESHHRIHVPLSEKQILEWAKEHRKNHKEYPTNKSGGVASRNADGETWANIDFALRFAQRGLTGYRSLEEFLTQYETRNHTLNEELILSWADEYCDRHGSYPKASSPGEIPNSDGKTWRDIDRALQNGSHGLPKHRPRRDLYDFLERHRSAGQLKPLKTNLTIKKIVAYATDHFCRTGEVPHALTGQIEGTHSETWANIEHALRNGGRGFAGGSSLQAIFDEFFPVEEREAILAAKDRADVEALADGSALVRNVTAKPSGEANGDLAHATAPIVTDVGDPTVEPLQDRQISDRDATTQKPKRLATKKQAVRSDETLSTTIKGKGGRRKLDFSGLDLETVLSWIDHHKKVEGYYPLSGSGKVSDDSPYTWSGIDKALKTGTFGDDVPRSLSKLIEHRRPRKPTQLHSITSMALPQTTVVTSSQSQRSVAVKPIEAGQVVAAKSTSEQEIVATHAPVSDQGHRGSRRLRQIRIDEKMIRHWIDEYHEATGTYPTIASGKIASVPTISWKHIAKVLEQGNGDDIAPGGSLSKFIFMEYGVIGGKVVAPRGATSHHM